MSRRLCFVVMIALSTFVALQHLGALEADEPAVAPAGGSLLERLSAETTALAERGERASALLVSEQGGVWAGALVGEPARFVVALEPTAVVADLPRTAKLRQAGQDEVDASLLDADAELGLAIYAPTGALRVGLAVGGPGALVRGALAVVADAPRPALVTLVASRGPLEDLPPAGEAGGVVLLAPGGALLGLAPSRSALADLQGCIACHAVEVRTAQVGGRILSVDPQPDWGARLNTPGLLGMHSKQPGRWLESWTHPPHAFTGLTGKGHGAGGAWAAHAQDRGAFVPGPVITRALEDIAQGRRLGRAYLGVVPEGTTSDKLVITSHDGRVRSVLLPRYVEAGADSAAASLPDAHPGFVRLSQVIADSPAAKAGLRSAQDILALDGVPVRGATHFARMLARRRPGETVRLAVRGLAEPVSIVLGDREKEGRTLATALSLGMEVYPLTRELGSFMGVQLGEGGVVVGHTTSDGAAAQAGLQHGDVIRDGGGGPIRDPAELDAVLGAAREGVLLGIERQGQRLAVTLNPPRTGAGLLPR